MPECVLVKKKKGYIWIYTREKRIAAAKCPKDSLHATQPFLQQRSKEQRLKRRSGRAVAHAGLERRRRRSKKKTAELAQVLDGAAKSPSRAKRRGISRMIPGAQIELRRPCSHQCSHVPMFIPHRPGAGFIGHAAASSGPSARPSGCLGQMEASGPWTRLRSQAALGGCRMKDGAVRRHCSQ
jgi:hypothetical protein